MTYTHAISSTGYTGPVAAVLVTAPTDPVLSVDDLRARLRLPFTDEDDQLAAFLSSAIAETENSLGRKLAPQVWRYWYDAVPCGRVITLPEPARSVAAIKVYEDDDDQTGTTITATEYRLDAQGVRIVFDEAATEWPPLTVRCIHAVSIEVAVGYAAATSIPQPILQALHLRVAGHYQRGAEPAHEAMARDTAITRLLNPYRFRMGVA